MVKIILLKRSSWICIHVDHLSSSRLRCHEIKTVTQIDPIFTRTTGSLRVSLVIEWRGLTYHGTLIICMSALRTAFLLPANKVWGKVMFIHLSVILFRGSLYDVTSCLTVWSHVSSGGSLSLVQCSFWGFAYRGGLPTRRVCLPRWFCLPRGLGRLTLEPEKQTVCILLECFLVVTIGQPMK